MTAALDIRPASPDDLEIAVETLEEAAAWMAALGEDGWTPGGFRSADGAGRRALEAALDARELFLAWHGVVPVGTVTLQSADAVYWPNAVELADARYVHRLAVPRRANGLGIGRALLRWSEAQTAANGRPFVRLDCPATSAFHRAYYLDAGYAHRGDVTVGDFRASLFEKTV